MSRPGPPYPAQECHDQIKTGNDGLDYISKPTANGVYRWVKLTGRRPSPKRPSPKRPSPKRPSPKRPSPKISVKWITPAKPGKKISADRVKKFLKENGYGGYSKLNADALRDAYGKIMTGIVPSGLTKAKASPKKASPKKASPKKASPKRPSPRKPSPKISVKWITPAKPGKKISADRVKKFLKENGYGGYSKLNADALRDAYGKIMAGIIPSGLTAKNAPVKARSPTPKAPSRSPTHRAPTPKAPTPKARSPKKTPKTVAELRVAIRGLGGNYRSADRKPELEDMYRNLVRKVSSSKVISPKGVGIGFGPMLANKYSEKTKVDGYYVSEKLDGIRSIYRDGVFYSRSNNVINAPQWFIDQMPKAVLDGELYTKRNDFQKVTSIVSKKVPIDSEWKEIKYMVFDLPLEPGDFTKRYARLKEVVRATKSPHLDYVEHVVVADRKHMEAIYDKLVAEGAEGVMLRKPDSKYETKRSSVLLKVKKFRDDEAVVIGYEYGKGKYENAMGNLNVKWYNKFNNVEFAIGSGFTDHDRFNFKTLFPIGTIVKVKYFELTKDNRPRFPIYLGIRAKFDV